MGITDVTMPRGPGWSFMSLGRYIERCMQMNGRLDGHIVQGHVDATVVCVERRDMNGSWEFRFRFPEQFTTLVIEKGSIAVDGISLTVSRLQGANVFSVAIIPHTFDNTNLKAAMCGDRVNLECDIVAKYVESLFKGL